jgi:mRNA interferase RelE/StbE
MASYSVEFKPAAEKDLRKLPKGMLPRVVESIEGLRAQPFPPQVIKLKNADRLYRIRVGDYRIVYEVEPTGRRVLVHYVRHRRDVYRSL